MSASELIHSPESRQFTLSEGVGLSRMCIDIGKTTCQFQLSQNGTLHEVVELDSTWTKGGYNEFISYISQQIAGLDNLAYVQISVPFPFDRKTQRISQNKTARPDFTPENDIAADIIETAKLNKATTMHIINDAEQKTRAAAVQNQQDSFLMIHSGSGVNMTTYQYGAIEVFEAHEIETTTDLLILKGVEIKKKIYQLAQCSSEVPFLQALEAAKESHKWESYQSALHQTWVEYVKSVTRKNPLVKTIIVPDKLTTNNLFPEEIIKELGLTVEAINQREIEQYGLQDLRYDQIKWEDRYLHKRPEFILNVSTWNSRTQRINERVNMLTISEAGVMATNLNIEVDIRTLSGEEHLYAFSRIIQRLKKTDHPVAHIFARKYQHPLPPEVRLNPYIPALNKFIVDFAESLEVIDNLKPGTNIAVVIPVYNETTRMLPPDSENPLGEDFVTNKAIQLEHLFSKSEGTYEIAIVDDASSDETFLLTQSIADKINPQLTKGSIQVHKLEDLINPALGLQISQKLKDPQQSIKGGASLAGVELASKTADYILLSDGDLEIHMGSLGLLLKPFLNDPETVLSVAHRQKLRSEAGKGIGQICKYLTDPNLFADKFKYLMKRYAYCSLYLPHLLEYPDFQTGFKVINAKAFTEFFSTNTNFKDSYDLNILEHALGKGTVHNIPITPVFVSKEATKFSPEAKMAKFDYYKQLARSRNNRIQYGAKNALMPLYYAAAVYKQLLIPSLTLPKKFRSSQNYFEYART